MHASTRRRPLTALALLVATLMMMVSFSAWSVASAKPRTTTYALPGENIFPEGIAFQPSERAFYVSATSDGTIFRGTLKEPVADVFLPGGEAGRTSATGLDLDRDGRLYISGGNTGGIWIYDTDDASLIAAFDVAGAGFVNDVAVTTGGAYFTDSLVPVIYRVYETAVGWQVEPWLDLTGTAIEYEPGFNLNGIVASPDGRYLIVVQSNTGELFRIDIASGAINEIDLGGATVTSGDGIEMRGRTLYVVRNSVELVVEIRLSGNLLSGRVVSVTTDPSYMFPTTAAIAGGRLLVVNAQFDQRGGNPMHPFTVSSVPLP